MKKELLFIVTVFTISLQSQPKIKSAIEENFDGTNWYNSQGYNYEYDIDNNLKTETSYSWNGSSWTQSYKSTYIYNANNKATVHTEQQWDAINQYVNSIKTTYTYDSEGILEEILDQNWDGIQWVNAYQTFITNVNMAPSSVIDYKWNGSDWVNDYRITLTYTGNNPTQIINEEWDGTQFNISDRDLFTYNTNNYIVTYVNEIGNGTAWSEDQRITYELDTNGNRIRETETYQASNTKTEYHYDLSAQLSTFLHPFKEKTGVDYFFEDFPYVNKILDQVNYNYDSFSSTYKNSSRTTYNYDSTLTLNTENFEQTPKIKLYPNPANSYIEIKGLTNPETVNVYSILGVKVLEKTINVDDKIIIKNFSNGLYFLKFKNGNTLKFLKN
ncbi:T9SS type A sorting domain-containing protein [Flavobacterium ovatum]|uniref:T9SS type A sorting domain-containing protein n=1 Tax=Flavobacterium ovatum TaxID=1928857 RepID=UPI00344B74DC